MRREAILALALVACTGCHSLDRRIERAPVVLREAGVTVHADARRHGDEYQVTAVGARSAHRNLRELTVTVFSDADGDGVLDDGEMRATWHASTGTPSSSISASGHVTWKPAPDQDLEGQLLVYSEVGLEDGGRYTSVRPFPAR